MELVDDPGASASACGFRWGGMVGEVMVVVDDLFESIGSGDDKEGPPGGSPLPPLPYY